MDSRLSFLLDHSNDFLCVIDGSGSIVETNRSFVELTGYSKAELLEKKANELLHPAEDARRHDLFSNLLSLNGRIDAQESRVKAKNGRYCNVRWSVIINPEDGLIYATGVNLTSSLQTAASEDAIDNLQHIIRSFNEGYAVVGRDWRIKDFNPAFNAMTGSSNDQLTDADFLQLKTLGITDEVRAEFEKAFYSNSLVKFQYFNAHFKRWLRFNLYPYKDMVTVFIKDITVTKKQQLILALEKDTLELNASSQNTLSQTVNELLKGIEQIFPDMICAVMEVNEEQEKVFHLAAPGLPAAYRNAISGMAIGPKAGSCGAAAYYRSPIIVSDIETDALWKDYRHQILPHGINACWSTPVMSTNSIKVLATIAVYYTVKREPRHEELHMIERTGNIIRILIENKRNQEHVNDQNKRLQEIASISSHEIRRPVATILGLTNLLDKENLSNPMNKEIMNHIDITARELDNVIHTIVEKTIYLHKEE